MGDGNNTESALESQLVDALSATLTRRMAERIVADVRRNRAGAALARDMDGLLAVVRGDLAQATFLRIGTRAPRVLAEVEDRLLGLAVLPSDFDPRQCVRLVYVGKSAAASQYFASMVGATDTVRIDELFELLMALDTDERTLVVVDSEDTDLDVAALARFVPDFPSYVVTFVAGSSPATREAFLVSGAAFRATLRHEPIDHPDFPEVLRDVVTGTTGGGRRSRSGTSTTTQPAQAA